MADDEQENGENNEEETGESGGKKKIILLIVVGLILIGISVGGTITVLKMMQPEPVVEEGEMAEEQPEITMPAIYYPLKPEYIVNIDARGRRRFLRLDLTVMTRDDQVIAAIELHRPSVDHIVNLIAGGQLFEEVQTAEGKELLRLRLLQELQALFEKEIGEPGIEQVLFTNFVMQ